MIVSIPGLMKFTPCLSGLNKMKSRSPDKFMDETSDVNMIDEEGYLSLNVTIRTNLNDDCQLHDEHIKTQW